MSFTEFLENLETELASTARWPPSGPVPPSLSATNPAASSSSSSATRGRTFSKRVSPCLNPLERATYHELTTRRDEIDRKRSEIEFWKVYLDKGGEGGGGKGSSSFDLSKAKGKSKMSDQELDAELERKKAILEQFRKDVSLKKGMVDSIDLSHGQITVLSRGAPILEPTTKQSDSQSVETPQIYTTRQLIDLRDNRALEFLRIDAEIKDLRKQRLKISSQTLALRQETASKIQSIRRLRIQLTERRLSSSQNQTSQSSTSQSQSGTDEAGKDESRLILEKKIAKLYESLKEVRAKREMVKGVLRGLLLESGRDWARDPELRELVLSLEDDEENSEDEFLDDEGDLQGFDEEEQEEQEEGGQSGDDGESDAD
ncbi:hypothetical protein IE53DRAFT_386084 [Violaceomyces palustris]|uniref:Uncharacterized protein n=1 Tax=Violaceomyces palustris TaxID=1673888 RepID=A0ACD0P0D8_9BASI|nr:hypothetical protein IE53DRAFT_386084 [Violaceomyces palustris]